MPRFQITRTDATQPGRLGIWFFDGSHTDFSLMWLLDSCPDGFHPQTGERAFDLLSVPDAPQLRSAQVLADGRLELQW
ncbi:MAG: hypothetical protein ABIR55_19220, partial [Burkholderiaceae bacterium]